MQSNCVSVQIKNIQKNKQKIIILLELTQFDEIINDKF